MSTNAKFKLVTMTPAWAQELLDTANGCNRNIRDGRVRQYAKDMEDGLWKTNWQPIAVDDAGHLVDGQHRLTAVIRANVDVPMYLVTGVARTDGASVDCGATRNVMDASRMAGKPLPKHIYATTARAMYVGIKQTRESTGPISHLRLLKFIDKHKRALVFVSEHLPSNVPRLTHGHVRAVIARAWYRKDDRQRLADFCKWLLNGLPDNIKTDGAVIALRNWLLVGRWSSGTEKPTNRMVIYGKTATALDAFLRGEGDCPLKASKVELFLLPEER